MLRIRKWNKKSSDPLPLYHILPVAQSAKATDPRDKVYGLLAFRLKAVSAWIHPSYSTDFDVWDAHTSFSKACFIGEGNLNSLARVRVYHSQSRNLPSWAFDLSLDHYYILMQTREKKHDANKNWDKRAAPTFSDDNRIMFCEGAFGDSIMVLEAAGYRTNNGRGPLSRKSSCPRPIRGHTSSPLVRTPG